MTVAIGIDLGGTKIEGALLDAGGAELARLRIAAPRGSYHGTLDALAHVVGELEATAGRHGEATVGIGMPGCISPASGLVQNSNSTWLNGQPLLRDVADRLGRPVRMANDANCFALSEAVDGAGAGAHTVFGVIVGTGCGGGIVIGGHILDGPRGTGGEWGHTPLPWPSDEEHATAPTCWCGRRSCMEVWASGTAIADDHRRVTGADLKGEDIVAAAAGGDAAAQATLDRHASRLARGLANICNVIDPDVVVLGGGLSRLAHLYRDLPGLVAPHIFSDNGSVRIVPPRWGDAGGVRGAAWLWR